MLISLNRYPAGSANNGSMKGPYVVTKIEDFNVAAQAAEEWVDDFTLRLGWHDPVRSYRALLAGLHALRDCMSREEAIYLGAGLPALLRGLYYEGWHGGRGGMSGQQDVFLMRIHDSVHRDPAIDPEQVARATFGLLMARLPAAEIENAKAATPSELHNLWPS